MTYPECPGCHKPEPADWCWVADFYCPLAKPPRYLDVLDVWRQVRTLTERVAALEAKAGALPPHHPVQGVPGATAVLCSCGWFSVDYAQHLREVNP